MMTAFSPTIDLGLPRARPQARPGATPRDARPRAPETPRDESGAAFAGLLLAVPVAIVSTALWFLLQGGGVWQLALVYALSGNLTFWLVMAGVAQARLLSKPGRRATRA